MNTTWTAASSGALSVAPGVRPSASDEIGLWIGVVFGALGLLLACGILIALLLTRARRHGESPARRRPRVTVHRRSVRVPGVGADPVQNIIPLGPEPERVEDEWNPYKGSGSEFHERT